MQFLFIDFSVDKNENQLNSFGWRKHNYCHSKCINYSCKHNSFEWHHAAVYNLVYQDSFESVFWDHRETALFSMHENSLRIFEKTVHLWHTSAALKISFFSGLFCKIMIYGKFQVFIYDKGWENATNHMHQNCLIIKWKKYLNFCFEIFLPLWNSIVLNFKFVDD